MAWRGVGDGEERPCGCAPWGRGTPRVGVTSLRRARRHDRRLLGSVAMALYSENSSVAIREVSAYVSTQASALLNGGPITWR